MDDPDEIMKCSCGLPMRRSRWLWHWAECKIASFVKASELDKKRLIANEKLRG